MADLPADLLVIVHHDDSVTRYEQVTYCPWPGGVTVYRNGEQIAEHNDVIGQHAERAAVPA
ncbi:hypothetical protein ACWT_5867 [Actinoplanes sp. SE50]|uniref:hypothetical protein n=1 Tax=unclassified Actinoplanes TaxID=2626549 RepID=UPI00023EBDD7|nr:MULTISPECIES: hypothetical protein [unclassified Actinoplanes]AEV86885.1 hypothetical protein ACPL_5998 [Actinoplanes sp. SE50/110]ATO85282.1 hypothetical protein ACWT_5867 [Actinoplanes sp. SE50]SLM02692.1 hypothetical protein ACSP50_5974 [Actinoplanes sp. SE50/110]